MYLNLQAPVLVMYLKIIQQHEDWGEEGVEMLTHVRVLDSKNKACAIFLQTSYSTKHRLSHVRLITYASNYITKYLQKIPILLKGLNY